MHLAGGRRGMYICRRQEGKVHRAEGRRGRCIEQKAGGEGASSRRQEGKVHLAEGRRGRYIEQNRRQEGRCI